jgi:phosphoribosylaminoimidazolecarboxamide formyltransferase/IMP cyclohydrolase
MKRIERALISVSDKAGVVEFGRALAERGIEILSTGGTARALREAGVPVKDIAAFTGFPEMLDGRVKTLHPKVHAGLLYLRDSEDHLETMRTHGLESIDLVCVNLYPFEATVAKPDVTFEEAIENIDIGGPTMLRSAAKNMKFVTVVCDPADYGRVLESLGAHEGCTTEGLRRELALKVFARVAGYNAAIARYLAEQAEGDGGGSRPLVVSYADGQVLRYGENPHQAAVFYRDPEAREAGIAHAEVLHGKEMSYNNYVDGDAALEAVKELSDEPAVAIIKHTNPCGCATGATLAEAFEAAWAGDPVSAFGSVIAVSRPVDLETARRLEGRFVEVLIAPDFAPDALDFLQRKSKQLRLLTLNRPCAAALPGVSLRQITGGLLVQDRDVGLNAVWNSPTRNVFPTEKAKLAEFGVKVCKHVKSNAILLVREYAAGAYSVLGMGAGQPNRVDAVRKLALTKALENLALLHPVEGKGETQEAFARRILSDAVLISDAFFPFPDNVHHAAEAGIRYLVEPGGSKRDDEVIAACDEHGIALLLTGMRHFRH